MKILFICTGNTCRSPIAEGVFKSLVEEKELNHECESAGTFAQVGNPPSKNSQIVMSEIGLDIKGHIAKQINDDLIDSVDLIITMTKSQKDSLRGLTDKVISLKKGDIIDPYMSDIGIYRKCRDEIKCALETLISEGVINGNKDN